MKVFTQRADEMRTRAGCQNCSSQYLYLMDKAEAEFGEVEFLACFQCLVGYTRAGKEMMRIA